MPTYTSDYTGAQIDAAVALAQTAQQSLERRYASADPYIYLGTAPLGTADDAPGWTLTRLTLALDGTVTATETASDAWDDRATATYS